MSAGNRNAAAAYGKTQKKPGAPRQTEARALLEAARRLDVAKNAPDDIDGLLTALRLNWRLWTIIQADVASEKNALPKEIKLNILKLSAFIDRHTVGLLAEPNAGKVGVLININKEIAAGLMTQPAGMTADAESAQGGAPIATNAQNALLSQMAGSSAPQPAPQNQTQKDEAPEDYVPLGDIKV